MDPLPSEIRAARAFLHTRGITVSKMKPARFAASAKELGLGFRQLLELLGLVLDKGQNEQEQRQRFLEKEELKLRRLPQ